MKDEIIRLFNDHSQLAFLISVVISIIIAILGLVPSFFLTAANIIFFGFWQGLLISFIGETIGAIIAFFIYRKGFKKITSSKLNSFPKLQALLEADNKKAFFLILYLRLIPFIPSGLVTFAAAIGKTSALTFIFASSLGKIPALLLEAYSVYQVTVFGWQGKLILTIVAILLIYFTIKRSLWQKENKTD